MSLLTILNIVIINLVALVGISYFWSFWTHKLFKPWGWLEMRKRKMLKSKVERTERTYKDRARYYSYFFAMQQIEAMEVQGAFALLGLEESELALLLREQCPERKIFAVGPMEASKITLVRENCQAEVTEETVDIDFVTEEEMRAVLPESAQNVLIKSSIREGLTEIEGPLALVAIDCVAEEDVSAALRYCYERLSAGGIMIVHSYNHDWAGVRRAVDAFAAGVAEGFVPLPDMYGSVVFVKNK